MGLDIVYYTNIKMVHGFKPDIDDDARVFRVRVSDGVPSRLGSLKEGYYTFETWKSFRAGSYGGYNIWRAQLAKLAGIEDLEKWWDSPDERPFAEMINFTDCDGVIGTEVAISLASDFEQYEEKARALFDDHGFLMYKLFRDAFKEAGSNNGAVVFR